MSTEVSESTGSFQTKDGLTLFTRTWQPAAPRAHIVHVHGIAEHSGRYEPLAAYLGQQGYAWHGYDQRGHGKSPGDRSYILATDLLLEDLDVFMAAVRAQAGDKPVFLMGQSLGGGLAALYVEEYQPDLAGMVLTSPMILLGADVTEVVKLVARILSRIAPKVKIQKLSSESISRDPEVRRAYDEDPLVFRGSLSARTGAVIMDILTRAQAGLGKITVPFLTMHGTADRITEVSGSQKLYDNAASQDKAVKYYDGLYHELLNEPEKDQVRSDIAAWLNAHAA